MTNLLTEALKAHARGWAFTPLSGKRPVAKGWTTKPRETEDMLRSWVSAGHNLGLRTGHASGVVVLDVDPAHGGVVPSNLDATPMVRTGGGGYHIYFAAPPYPVKNSAGALGPGLDIKADGGQVVFPGSIHPDTGVLYDWCPGLSPYDVPLSPFPARLLPQEIRPPTPAVIHAPTRYVEAAVASECASVATAPVGMRNNALNRAAHCLGGYVHTGADESAVAAQLVSAGVAAGLPEREARATVASGLRSGKASPRRIPEPKQPISPPVPSTTLKTTTTYVPDPSSPWPDPILFTAPTDNLPPWPDAAFEHVPVIQEFVSALSESTETPIELPAMMTLAVLATAVHAKACVRVRHDYIEPLCLWTLCALPVGSRKTAVLNAAMSPLVRWQCDQARDGDSIKKQTQQARQAADHRIDSLMRQYAKVSDEAQRTRLMQEIESVEKSKPGEYHLPVLFTADATPEAVAAIMADNNDAISILSDEGGIFDTIAGRYSHGVPNLDVYLKGHACSALRVDRLGRPPLWLAHPVLSMGICPQPTVVEQLQGNRTFLGRGFLGRFLWTMPTSNLGQRTGDTKPLPVSVSIAYSDTVRRLVDMRGPLDDRFHYLTLDDGAYDLYRRFWAEVEDEMDADGRYGKIADFGSKLPGAVVRLAGVLHCARHAHSVPWAHPIGADTMSSAVEIGRCLTSHAEAAYGMLRAGQDDAIAGRILDWARRYGLAEFSARAAQRGTKCTKAEAQAGLDELEQRHIVRVANTDARTKSTTYQLNPAAL